MGKHYFASGRGGAGNIHSTDSQLQPKEVDQGSQTPELLQPVFSTGRGGAGNMMKNDDPKLTRILQDVDQDPNDYITPVLSNKSQNQNNLSFGRGGYGNMISPKNSANESQQKQREKAGSNKKEKEGGFLKKAKNFFKK